MPDCLSIRREMCGLDLCATRCPGRSGSVLAQSPGAGTISKRMLRFRRRASQTIRPAPFPQQPYAVNIYIALMTSSEFPSGIPMGSPSHLSHQPPAVRLRPHANVINEWCCHEPAYSKRQRKLAIFRTRVCPVAFAGRDIRQIRCRSSICLSCQLKVSPDRQKQTPNHCRGMSATGQQ
jgi:hypothetical protein